MAEDRTRVCEVCQEPVSPDQPTVKVGSCEFPFDVHDECRGDMAPVAEFVEELCALSDEQPEGVLNLGEWSDEPTPGQGGEAAGGDAETATAFIDAYVAEAPLPPQGPLNVENDAVYLDGWWPGAIRLPAGAYAVRTEADPAGLDLPRLFADCLTRAGLRRCAVDDRLLESISLQRVGLLGSSWEVWAVDDTAATDAVAAAAAG